MVQKIKNYSLEIFSLLCVLVGFVFFSKVLVWNETRAGYGLNDIIMNHIGPFENHFIIFGLTYGLIIFGLSQSLKTRIGFVQTMWSIIFFILLRTATLILFPLNPPKSIIPLQDFFLTNTFYDSKVLVRDLFFSGHTAAVFLLFFLANSKITKSILCIGGICLGTLLVLQHVHYTIDVLAAPIFAYVAVQLGTVVQLKITNLFSKFFVCEAADFSKMTN